MTKNTLNPTLRVDSRETLAKRLKAARKQRRLGEIELAASAGVARGTVRHAESGEAPVTIDTLLRIADALALDLFLVPRERVHPLLE